MCNGKMRGYQCLAVSESKILVGMSEREEVLVCDSVEEWGIIIITRGGVSL